MDLNQLLFHHQVALMGYAARPACERDNGSHFDLVRHYETRIDRLRQDAGVAIYPRLA